MPLTEYSDTDDTDTVGLLFICGTLQSLFMSQIVQASVSLQLLRTLRNWVKIEDFFLIIIICSVVPVVRYGDIDDTKAAGLLLIY